MQTPKRGNVGSLEQNGWLGFANQPLCNIMRCFLFFFTGSLMHARREECVAKEQSAWLYWVWNPAVYYVMYLSIPLPILLWVDDVGLKPGSILHHVFIPLFAHSSVSWWLGSETWQYITSCIYLPLCPIFCELMTSVSNQAVCYIMYLSLSLCPFFCEFMTWVWNLAVYYVMYLSLPLPILLWVHDFSLKPGSMLHHVFISHFTHSSLRWWLGSETRQYIMSACIYPSLCPYFCDLMTWVWNLAVYNMYLPGSVQCHVFISLLAHSSLSWWLGAETWQYITSCISLSLYPFIGADTDRIMCEASECTA